MVVISQSFRARECGINDDLNPQVGMQVDTYMIEQMRSEITQRTRIQRERENQIAHNKTNI